MTSNTLLDFALFYYRRHLFETAEKLGVESFCFILDSCKKDITALYKKYRALFRLC